MQSQKKNLIKNYKLKKAYKYQKKYVIDGS